MHGALTDQVIEEGLHFIFIIFGADVEDVDHYVFVVLVYILTLIVHAEADLAEVQVLPRELEPLQELLFVWEFVLGLLFRVDGDTKLVIEDLGAAP